tara:strand:+ start:30709 stop:30966 length:258 start_codon:yes stop_codon:yes gene_type:complete
MSPGEELGSATGGGGGGVGWAGSTQGAHEMAAELKMGWTKGAGSNIVGEGGGGLGEPCSWGWAAVRVAKRKRRDNVGPWKGSMSV